MDLAQACQHINDVQSRGSLPLYSTTMFDVSSSFLHELDSSSRNHALAKILVDSTSELAGAAQARNSPCSLKYPQDVIMERAREWRVCTFNQFRKYLGLRRKFHVHPDSAMALMNGVLGAFRTFEEWNSSPQVIAAATALYGSIDSLELYVCMMPGHRAIFHIYEQYIYSQVLKQRSQCKLVSALDIQRYD